jgi:hypothetical protein
LFLHDVIFKQAISQSLSPRLAYNGAKFLYEGNQSFQNLHSETIALAYEDSRDFGKRNVRKRGKLKRPDRIVLSQTEIDSIVKWFQESSPDDRIVQLGRILMFFDATTIKDIYTKIQSFIQSDVEHLTESV